MLRLSESSPNAGSSLLKSHNIAFRKNWVLHLLIAIFVLYWLAMAIHPVDYRDFYLESALPFILIAVLAFLYRHFAFNNISYILITVFFILHLTGAHYAYEYSPVDFWFKGTFHSERGISDRLVHFAFGLLMVYPLEDMIIRLMKTKWVWSYVITFSVIMAASALFEILEMLVGLMANPQLAEQYLGLQGDVLDTQKDMMMSLCGAVIGIGCIAGYRYFKQKDPSDDDGREGHKGIRVRVR
ncbi:DUF2238 domain-containing protein [Paenibacillus sp. UNC451MF]|uniref:DUF2238 domain-containing protein n=1 Tax=Paenibacillus sp. UNC451MF TaxID=1449063 RepID=UPI00068CBBF8|nr:DUF2238 domain-containing protein [Paenibacillus sp. UNC451MF]